MRCVWGEETTGIYADDDEVDECMSDVGSECDLDDEQMTSKAMAEVQSAVDRMSLDELLSARWPAFHGTGLFPSVARLNHDCSPNVRVTFPLNSSRLSAVALTPLTAGDELCISYVNKDE